MRCAPSLSRGVLPATCALPRKGAPLLLPLRAGTRSRGVAHCSRRQRCSLFLADCERYSLSVTMPWRPRHGLQINRFRQAVGLPLPVGAARPGRPGRHISLSSRAHQRLPPRAQHPRPSSSRGASISRAGTPGRHPHRLSGCAGTLKSAGTPSGASPTQPPCPSHSSRLAEGPLLGPRSCPSSVFPPPCVQPSAGGAGNIPPQPALASASPTPLAGSVGCRLPTRRDRAGRNQASASSKRPQQRLHVLHGVPRVAAPAARAHWSPVRRGSETPSSR